MRRCMGACKEEGHDVYPPVALAAAAFLAPLRVRSVPRTPAGSYAAPRGHQTSWYTRPLQHNAT